MNKTELREQLDAKLERLHTLYGRLAKLSDEIETERQEAEQTMRRLRVKSHVRGSKCLTITPDITQMRTDIEALKARWPEAYKDTLAPVKARGALKFSYLTSKKL